MVLNVVISAPRQVLGDLRPSVAQFLMSLDDEHIFLLRPLVLLDVRVQVVVPSLLLKVPFPALLSLTVQDVTRDQRPVLRTLLLHETTQQLVLRRAPRTLVVHLSRSAHGKLRLVRSAVRRSISAKFHLVYYNELTFN